MAFVQVSGETFQKRELTLGMQDGAFVQVLAGLSAGERVVTKGAYAIRLASVSTTIPATGMPTEEPRDRSGDSLVAPQPGGGRSPSRVCSRSWASIPRRACPWMCFRI